MRRAWAIEIVLFLLYFVFGVSWFAYSPLMPEMMTNFTVNDVKAASLIGCVSFAKAFVPMLVSLLAARIGVARSILIGALLASLALVIPLFRNYEVALVLRFFFGVGGAVLVTLMGAMVIVYFPRSQLPFINGINNVAVNAGITTTMFISIPLAGRYGWQPTLLAYGAISLVLALCWAALTYGESRGEVVKQQVAGNDRLMDVLAMKETWLLALGFTGALALYLSLNTFLPKHYAAAFGMTRAEASYYTGLFNLIGIPTAILAGLFTGKLGLRRPLIILAGLMMCPSAIGMVTTANPSVRYVCLALLGMSFFLYVSPLFTIPMELPGANPTRVALMNGVIYSVAYSASFLSPIIVGQLKERTGSYTQGLELFACTSVVLAIAGWLLPETGPNARKS